MDHNISGGSAFPLSTVTATEPWSGLTKRDYFAAMALCGMLAANIEHDEADELSSDAYWYADAMMTAREEE